MFLHNKHVHLTSKDVAYEVNAQRDDEAYFHQSIRAYKKHEIERAFYRVELHIVWVTADMRVIKLEKGDKVWS